MAAVAAVPSMLARGGGSVVNTASTLALTALPGAGAYSASKAGVMGLTRAMALEWTPLGIRTNCVLPGSTDTDMMWAGVPEDELEDRRLAEESVLPIGRIGQPVEIAEATLWLAGPRSSFASGTFVVVDGGALSEYPGPRYVMRH